MDFKFYIKRKEPINPDYIQNLQRNINEQLSAETTIEIIDTKGSLPIIDWRWHRNGPPHPLNNLIVLAGVVDEKIIAGTMTSGSNINLPKHSLVLNWINSSNFLDDKYKADPPNFFEENLFDANNSSWVKATDEYLYHYTSWDIAKDHILSGKQSIRFGFIRHMNDPLEFTRINVPLYGNPTNDDKMPLRMWKSIEASTKEGVQLFCTTQDISARLTFPGPVMHSKAKRGFSHAPMWQHYADSHEGVCLIFDKKKLTSAITDTLSAEGKVIYSEIQYVEERDDLASVGAKFEIMKNMESWSDAEINHYTRKIAIENFKTLFFKKNTAWAYETEYRWIFLSDSKENALVPIKDALAGIILGSDFNASQHQTANLLAKQNKIPIRRIWWNNGIASTPWDTEAFEKGDTLETWEKEAKKRRKSRREK